MHPNRRTSQVIIEEISESGSEEEFGSPLAEVESPHFTAASSTSSKSQGTIGGSIADESSAPPAAGNDVSTSAEDKDSAENTGPVVLTEEEEASLLEAEGLKAEGNALYGQGHFEEALEKYRKALDLAPEDAAQQRAVFYANAAAVCIKLEQFAEAAKDCSACLSLDPVQSLQIKALTRRGLAYEQLKEVERAFADYEKLVELDPKNSGAKAAVRRLKPIVEEQREKMKAEMMDKLKELGNTVLGKFGMSLDNFKAVQDPQTGSYSINFSQ